MCPFYDAYVHIRYIEIARYTAIFDVVFLTGNQNFNAFLRRLCSALLSQLFFRQPLRWLPQREEWLDLQAVVRIESVRTLHGQTSRENRYYLSSASSDAETFLKNTRGHWSIENSLHWVLDVAFCEDACRLRKGYGAENFATLRHIVVNLLQHDHTSSVGMRTKRLQAGWDVKFREHVLKTGGIDMETLSRRIG